MRLSIGQDMRMAQKQILAPRMIQSMEILQLPILELQERIEQELQENPVLELREEEPELPAEADSVDSREIPDAPTEGERELVINETTQNEDDFERLCNMDEECPEAFNESVSQSRGGIEEAAERKHDALANTPAHQQTLHDYLRDQLAWFDLDEATRAMAERIIYNLDPNGYLQGRLEDVLPPTASAEELELAQAALKLVQRLDPPGVGARDLRECLLLQVRPGQPFEEELRTLISDHLEDIEANRLPAIKRKTGWSIERIQEVVTELRRLNPKPGADFYEELVQPVTPDVYVEQDDSGRYVVRLDDARLPSLYISPYYRQLLSGGQAATEAREWIKRKINSAQWLIEAIEQRRQTLTKVSQAIVDHQIEFLNRGPEHIEPLKMQQIADKVGVHVTTVSRAVDDKWIQTPRGIFPLKRFFCGGTVGADGVEVAWDTVRMKLQELIDNEDKQHPLSDEELMAKMAEQGITVARRTVTKYRKAMRIPSSRQRRAWTEAAEGQPSADES